MYTRKARTSSFVPTGPWPGTSTSKSIASTRRSDSIQSSM